VSWPIFRSGEFLLEQKIVVFKATLAEARFFFFTQEKLILGLELLLWPFLL